MVRKTQTYTKCTKYTSHHKLIKPHFGKSQNLFNYRAECCRGITAKSQIFGKEIKHFIKINAMRLTGVLFLSRKDVKLEFVDLLTAGTFIAPNKAEMIRPWNSKRNKILKDRSEKITGLFLTRKGVNKISIPTKSREFGLELSAIRDDDLGRSFAGLRTVRLNLEKKLNAQLETERSVLHSVIKNAIESEYGYQHGALSPERWFDMRIFIISSL